jgi:hypothetical protein
MTVDDLKRLRNDTNSILAALCTEEHRIPGAINWGDVRCTEASWRVTDDDYSYPSVLIEEASPAAHELGTVVYERLLAKGWPKNLDVCTAW